MSHPPRIRWRKDRGRPITGYRILVEFKGRRGPVCVGRRKTWRAAKRLGNFYYGAPKFIGVAECYIQVDRGPRP